jgi:Zn-dependent protease
MERESQDRYLQNLHRVARHLGGAEKPAPAPSATPRKSGRRSGRLVRLGGPALVLAFLLGKLKLIVPLLKFGNVGMLATMAVSVWAYALAWGFRFALGFVLLIFIHEMGHALVMRKMGIPAGAPVFIPFVGAVIAMKGRPRDAFVESVVGIGGPALGTLGALVCLGIGVASGSLFWYALASTGFLINLFNMIPVSPLDGGRIVGVISRWFWVVGYAVGIAVFLRTHSPILLIILVLGLLSLVHSIRSGSGKYYAVPASRRLAMGVAYFSLLAVMALGMWVADHPLRERGPSSPEGREAVEARDAVRRRVENPAVGAPLAGLAELAEST